jgi:hypothetical protein
VAIEKIPFDWVSLSAVAIAFVAVVVSTISIFMTRRSVKYQLISDLLAYRYDDKTLQARRALRAWNDKYREKHLGEKFEQLGNREKAELDKHRRYFFAYFRRILDLYESKILRYREIRGLVNQSDLSMLLCIDKPLEESVHRDLYFCPELVRLEKPEKRKKKLDLFQFFQQYHKKTFC